MVYQVNSKVSDQAMEVIKTAAIKERTSVSAIVTELVEQSLSSIPAIAREINQRKQQTPYQMQSEIDVLKKELAELKKRK